MTPTPGVAAPWALAAATIGAQILYPLTDGSARDAVTVAVVVLSAATCLVHATVTRGPRWAGALLVITAGVGFVSEVVGTATGVPYGCYTYAVDRIGPSLLDVPLVVPFAWTAGMYPIWCVAERVWRSVPARLSAVVVAMVGWDLYLDPQMVADGQWSWCGGPGLPGLLHIPVTNYAGWLLVAALMAVALHFVDRRCARPGDVPGDGVPVALFLWTWLGSALAHLVFLDAPELRFSALYGLVAMGTLGLPLVWSTMSARRATRGRRRAGTRRLV
ncbi:MULTISPECIES: carotenoid biosynthesis protein [Rhodococcus]|uniref:carotenoid biosynthesis protein n=1 Tax=Rhodococcus TaxID=1827 RepID=UPI001CF8233C|nr:MULTISPECIES: carotenoid biosynthesis protein [Rhodococcus]